MWVELEQNSVKRLLEEKRQVILSDSYGEIILDTNFVKRTDTLNKTTYSDGSWIEKTG